MEIKRRRTQAALIACTRQPLLCPRRSPVKSSGPEITHPLLLRCCEKREKCWGNGGRGRRRTASANCSANLASSDFASSSTISHN